MFDTRLLRTFRAVVVAGSFSGAARELGYTQPAISQHMRSLEQAAGMPLFIRVGRSMQLTDAGKLLDRHAQRILEDLSAAQRQIAATRTIAAGRVRVCTFPSASATIVASAAADLQRTSPGLRMQLTEAEPPESLEMLAAGKCDIALAFRYGDAPADDEVRGGLIATRLLDDDMMALLPRGHRLARRRSVDLAQLADESWIAGCPNCRSAFLAACAAAGFEPEIAFSTDDNLAVQSLVVAGVGVAIMPELVLSFLRHPKIVAQPLGTRVRRSVSAYTLPDHGRMPATIVTMDALKAAATRQLSH
jgi:DNA-binding transcriptional LysR family regulator